MAKLIKQQKIMNRVAVFIDHSNVIHDLIDLRKIDPNWSRWYNPLFLAQKLSGSRDLISVFFYCAPPPHYLLKGNKSDKRKYWKQISHYETIKKLPLVNLKLARIVGNKKNIHEKKS